MDVCEPSPQNSFFNQSWTFSEKGHVTPQENESVW